MFFGDKIAKVTGYQKYIKKNKQGKLILVTAMSPTKYGIGKTTVSIYNPEIKKGLKICYDTAELKYFTEWKMMGYRDYVLGLEPGNCHPDGRDVMRKEGKLKFLQPGEAITYEVTVTLYDK